MRIAAVHLKNIRSYVDATVRFGPGTTLLVGDVGSGKTSVLYAIEMAMFGFAEVDPAYLVRQRAREAEVELTVENAGERIAFRRRFRRRVVRGKDTFEAVEASLARNGNRTSYSATELRQRAIDLLGFPDNPNPRAHSDVWRWAVYIPQERMREVLAQAPTERLETVRKALGLEQYQLAAENAGDLAAELRRIAELHETEANQLRHWEEERPRWAARHAALGRELEGLGAEELRLRAAVSTAERSLAGAEERRQVREAERRERERLRSEELRQREEAGTRRGRAAKLRAEVVARRRAAAGPAGPAPPEEAALQGMRERLLRRRADLESSAAVLVEEARVTAEHAALRAAASAAEERLAQVDADRAEVAERRAQAEAEPPHREPRPPTPKTVDELVAELALRHAELNRAHERVAETAHLERDLHELLEEGVCPRCHQAVRPEEFQAHYEQATTAHAAALAQVEELGRAVADLEAARASRERYERARERFEQVRARRAELATAAERLAARREELLVEGAEREERATSLERALAALAPRLAARLALADEVDRLQGEVDSGEAAQVRAVREAEQARAARSEADLLESEAVRADEDASQLEARAEAAAQQVARLDASWLTEPDPARIALEQRNALEAVRAELERTLGRLTATRTQIDEAERRTLEADAGVRLRAERLGEAERSRRLAGWAGREFREGMLDLEKLRLARAQAEFNRSFGRYFATLLEDAALHARVDAAFTPIVENDGEDTPAEALSGGERTALALAYRLAMGKVVRAAGKLRITSLLLDEPTEGFSPEQVSRMGELLEELALPQVLLVSHESQLAGVADRVLTVRKVGGVSVVAEGTPLPTEGGRDGAEAPAPPTRARRRRAGTLTEAVARAPAAPTEGPPPPSGSR